MNDIKDSVNLIARTSVVHKRHCPSNSYDGERNHNSDKACNISTHRASNVLRVFVSARCCVIFANVPIHRNLRRVWRNRALE